MTYDLLTVDQQLTILSQRKLEIEADLFAQRTENALAKELGMAQVEASTAEKVAAFERAIEFLDDQISALEGATSEPKPKPVRRKAS